MLPSYVDIHSAYHYPSYVNLLSTTPVIGHVMRGISTAGQFASDHALPIVTAIAAHQLYTKAPGAYKEWKDGQKKAITVRSRAPTTTAQLSDDNEEYVDVGSDIKEIVTPVPRMVLHSKNIPPADKKSVDVYYKELVKRIETMDTVDDAIESLGRYRENANDNVRESIDALNNIHRGNRRFIGNPYIPEDYIKKSKQRYSEAFPNTIKKIEEYTNRALRNKEGGYKVTYDPDSFEDSGLNTFEYSAYRQTALAVQQALGMSKTSVHQPFTASMYIPKALRGKVKIE